MVQGNKVLWSSSSFSFLLTHNKRHFQSQKVLTLQDWVASEGWVIPVYTTAQCLFKHEPKLSCVRGTSTWQCQHPALLLAPMSRNALCHIPTAREGGSMKPSPKFRTHHPKAVRGTIHHGDSSSMWNGVVWRIMQTGIWCLESQEYTTCYFRMGWGFSRVLQWLCHKA